MVNCEMNENWASHMGNQHLLAGIVTTCKQHVLGLPWGLLMVVHALNASLGGGIQGDPIQVHETPQSTPFKWLSSTTLFLRECPAILHKTLISVAWILWSCPFGHDLKFVTIDESGSVDWPINRECGLSAQICLHNGLVHWPHSCRGCADLLINLTLHLSTNPASTNSPFQVENHGVGLGGLVKYNNSNNLCQVYFHKMANSYSTTHCILKV